MSVKRYYGYSVIGHGASLYANFEMTDVTKSVFNMYENFNKETFDSVPNVPVEMISFSDMVYNAHNQTYTFTRNPIIEKRELTRSNDDVVVLGFSGGLDSVFQALRLIDSGYKVVLFHLKGVNTYENGQGTKHSIHIADKLKQRGVEYVECEIKKTNDKSNAYKQHWPENPIKNQLILAMMIDYCIVNGYHKISLGDDFDLSIDDAMVGVNLTDSRELTQEFLKCICSLVSGIEFIPIEKGQDKLKRLKTIEQYGLLDDYYSCVLPGRFNATRHESNEQKYNVTLSKNNCGCSCRKCAMHNLLMHYGGVKIFPDEFIESCWKVMWKNAHSADYKFFSPDLSLETRLKNLFEY